MHTRPKSHVFSGTMSKNCSFYLKIGLSKSRFPFLHNILHKNILSSTSKFRIKFRGEKFPIAYSVICEAKINMCHLLALLIGSLVQYLSYYICISIQQYLDLLTHNFIKNSNTAQILMLEVYPQEFKARKKSTRLISKEK